MSSLRRTSNLGVIAALDTDLVDGVLSTDDLTASTWWLWREQGAVAGYCGVREWKGDAYLIRAGVKPQARGLGGQRRMIAVRVRWAKARGFARVVTYTTDDNIASMRNLIREGFMPYTPDSGKSGGYLFWELRLKSDATVSKSD